MRLSTSHLRRYCTGPLPSGTTELRALLDDVGVEVKRIEDDGAFLAVELLANRGDHRCYAGIAREMAGRVGGAVQMPDVVELTTGPSPIAIHIETPLCLLYSATRMSIPSIDVHFPDPVQEPLIAAGLQPVNAAVDATNLVNLEIGQPTHLFDADTIVGAITIREARKGETALPLFAEKRVEVPTGAIVIADEEKVLAIAGVIGCEESKVTDATRNMILESATFDPVAVRKAGRALGIHTDSSARFERGSDPSLPLTGAGRVVYLLETHAGAKREGTSGMVGDWTNPNRTIDLNPAKIGHYFHRDFSQSELTERLTRYGFSIQPGGENLAVTVPPGRLWDVHNPEDLYEEIAKSIGYNELPETMPANTMGVRPTQRQQLRHQMEQVLLGTGFYETITDGFYGRDLRERLLTGDGHPLWSHVETVNSMDKGYSLLKNNCLGQALLGLGANIRMGLKQVRMFEFTRTFHPDPNAENGVCTERHVLWALAHGANRDDAWDDHPAAVNAWLLKGVLEEFSTELRCPLELSIEGAESEPVGTLLHPYRRAAIVHNGQTVGVLGEVAPECSQGMGLKKARPCYLELDIARLGQSVHIENYIEPSARPLSTRMLAFSLPARVEAGRVKALLESAGPDWLEAVDITDLFAHVDDDQPMRAVTFALRFRNDESDRSTEFINAETERLSATVIDALGSHGVRQRA